jgi:hypothetical protein
MGGVAYRRRISNDPPESYFLLHFCVYVFRSRPLERSVLQRLTTPAAILSQDHD